MTAALVKSSATRSNTVVEPGIMGSSRPLSVIIDPLERSPCLSSYKNEPTLDKHDLDHVVDAQIKKEIISPPINFGIHHE